MCFALCLVKSQTKLEEGIVLKLLTANQTWLPLVFLLQVCKDLSEEYERLVNPEKAQEDSKPIRIKEEPMSDISFPVSEEPEADLASGDQALPMGVLGTHNERLTGLDGDNCPHTSGEIAKENGQIMICGANGLLPKKTASWPAPVLVSGSPARISVSTFLGERISCVVEQKPRLDVTL